MQTKNLLLTGATGTFGRRFIEHYINDHRFTKLTLFSRDEFKQYTLRQELIIKYGLELVESKLRFILGDIRDYDRLQFAMSNVEIVVHAAALKHVTFCEQNPYEATKTNVHGTMNVCSAAASTNVDRVIILSTDKAVEPINFYGATKMLAERYAIACNNDYSTKFSCVRYGNIFGSRGSLVEKLRAQMLLDEPFTITDERMTRFWFYIDDAVELISWTIDNMIGGELVVPQSTAANVVQLARGFDCTRELKYIGIMPGEKLHEQLFSRREHEFALTSPDGALHVIYPEDDRLKKIVRTHYESIGWANCQRISYQSNDDDLQMSDVDIKKILQR